MELSRILNDSASVARPASPVASVDSDTDLRVGKWTEEEERFALELIKHFLAGVLTVTPGVSLRSFLAKTLRCSPMRISTKLAMDSLGGESIAKRLGQKRFFPMDTATLAQRQEILMTLRDLEIAFLEKENIDVETAMADSLMGSTNTASASTHRAASDNEDNMSDDSSGAVRIGSWSDEEQTYAAALIDGFLRGLLDLPQGTTLRAYLAERLCCNPMRISKKLATGMMANQTLPKRLGSATFQPARDITPFQIARTEDELARLRDACFSPGGTPCVAGHDENDRRHHIHSKSSLAMMPYHTQPLSPLTPTKKRTFMESARPQLVLPPLSHACKRTRPTFVHQSFLLQ